MTHLPSQHSAHPTNVMLNMLLPPLAHVKPAHPTATTVSLTPPCPLLCASPTSVIPDMAVRLTSSAMPAPTNAAHAPLPVVPPLMTPSSAPYASLVTRRTKMFAQSAHP